MKINKMSHSRMRSGFAGRASFCGLVVVLVAALLCPAGWDASVYAEGDNPDIINSAPEEGSQATDTNEPVALSDDADAGIDMLAATAGIKIGGDAYNKQVTVAPGETGYREHTVQLTGSDISAYTLKISGTPNLTGPNGSTTVTGAGGKTPAVMSDNTWGYAWGAEGTAKESMSYQSVTSAGTALTADPVSGTTLNSTRKLAFAAKFGASNIAGRYTGTVTLSMVATPTATVRTLSYNLNSGTGSFANQTCDDYGTGCTITMHNADPTRTNYTFQGWSTTSGGSVNSTYGKGKTVTLTSNVALYAVWKANGQNWSDGTSSGVDYMQDITTGTSASSFCKSSLPNHASITLKDKRDDKSYTIVKMADGKCWMTQNLQLMGSRTLTSADSNVTSNYTLPASSTSGFSSDTASNAYLSGNTGYYTWCAATAGTCSSATSGGQQASSSICPKGWKLPSGNSGGEFEAFANAEGIANSSTGSTKIRGAPYNFAYAGYMYNGSGPQDATSQGYWWSRTASNSNNAYYLNIDGSYVDPGTYSDYRRYGRAVRCVAQ